MKKFIINNWEQPLGAKSYANLFMAGLEKKIFENTNFKPLLWRQHFDDTFGIWTEGFERLQEFYQCLNSFHPTIKFTMEFSKEQINFLDVNISQKRCLTNKSIL